MSEKRARILNLKISLQRGFFKVYISWQNKTLTHETKNEGFKPRIYPSRMFVRPNALKSSYVDFSYSMLKMLKKRRIFKV